MNTMFGLRSLITKKPQVAFQRHLTRRNFNTLLDSATRVVPRERRASSFKIPTSTPSHSYPLTTEFPGTPEVALKGGLPHTPPQISTLDNGIRIITQETYAQAAGISVFIDSGGKYETDDTHGISHMLERMSFKGTSNRSAKELIGQIEEIGGNIIASSSREAMVYYADVIREHIPKMMDCLADSLLNPLYLEEDLKDQKELIAFETSQLQLDSLVPEMMHEVAFQGQALGRPMVSTPEQLENLTTTKLYDWQKLFYRPERMVISAAGVNHESFVELVNKYFRTSSPPPATPVVPPKIKPSRYTGGGVAKEIDFKQFPPSKNQEVSHLILAFEGASVSDPNLLKFATLQTLLGGGGSFSSGGPGKGMYSRLYRRVLNGHAFVESAQAFNISYLETGVFGIHGTVIHGALHEMVEILCGQLLELSKHVGDIELNRAKNQLKSSILMALEVRATLSDDLGRQLMYYNQYYPPDYFCNLVDSITRADLCKLVHSMLLTKPTALAFGRDTHEFPSENAISKFLRNELP